MKDLVITGRTLARELKAAALCVALGECANLYAIIKFKTAWSELLTMLPLALALALVLYVASLALRAFLGAVLRLIKSKRPST